MLVLGQQYVAQLMLTYPCDASRGQWRSQNMAQFDILGMAYIVLTHRFWDTGIWLQKMSWPWNPGHI